MTPISPPSVLRALSVSLSLSLAERIHWSNPTALKPSYGGRCCGKLTEEIKERNSAHRFIRKQTIQVPFWHRLAWSTWNALGEGELPEMPRALCLFYIWRDLNTWVLQNSCSISFTASWNVEQTPSSVVWWQSDQHWNKDLIADGAHFRSSPIQVNRCLKWNCIVCLLWIPFLISSANRFIS